MDEEERARVIAVEQEREARQRRLFDKEQDEQLAKQKRRLQGKEQLQTWVAERKRVIEQTRKNNKTDEEEGLREVKRLKETSNPWERVVSNVEIQASQYVGQADVARMRQAMVARKNDITKGGAAAAKKSLF